jgi:hypothetical protein
MVMNSNDYAISLQDPKWKAKSAKIRDRDGHKCVKCGAKGVELHVHHKYYIFGREPWDYTDKALITLCGACHDKEHAGKDISEFFRNGRRKAKPVKKKRNRIKKVKLQVIEEIPVVEKRSPNELKELLTKHKEYKETVTKDDLDKMVLDEFNKRHPEHIKHTKKRHNKNALYKFRVREMKKIRKELKNKTNGKTTKDLHGNL